MKRWFRAVPALLGLVAACSGSEPGAKDEATGTLALQLTATDSHGEIYRLRNAVFQVSGYPYNEYPSSGEGGASSVGYYSASLSSETDPNAAIIKHRVLPGYYYVTFDTQEPWYMEHVTSHGPERVEHSVLLSSVTQYAYVYDGGTSSVFYQFGVDGTPLDFRHGHINIGIGVEHPNEGQGEGGFGGAAF